MYSVDMKSNLTEALRNASDIQDPNVLPRKMTSFILGTLHYWFVSKMYEQDKVLKVISMNRLLPPSAHDLNMRA